MSAEYNENGEVIKMTEEIVTTKTSENSKPGETLTVLKEALKHSIAETKKQLHAKRVKEFKLYEEEIYTEDHFEEPDPFEEDDFNIPLSGSESEEEDEVEDEETIKAIFKDKKRTKSAFVDEEAEESDEPEDDEENNEDEDDVDPKQPSDDLEDTDAVSSDDEETPSEIVLPKIHFGSFVDKNLEEKSTHLSSSNLLNDLAEVESQYNDEDLLDMCSGKFITQPNTQFPPQNFTESEDFKLQFPDKFTEDFTCSQSTKVSEQAKSQKILSDDEDEELVCTKKVVRRTLKLTFSDDEDEENEVTTKPQDESEPEEEDEEKEIASEDDEGEKPTQDSEDNDEIADNASVLSGEDDEQVPKTGAGFLDVEAELSESDWDSADEDEKGLEDYEQEQADQEKIDQKKLRAELEQIHMKQLMDEDKRDVRLLQEMFLEDGELHSDGLKRQRLFRWSNNVDDKIQFMDALDDDGYEDEEDEEEWRKNRHERETFLKKTVPLDDEQDVEIETLAVINVEKKTTKPTSGKPLSSLSPDIKRPFKLLTKRGSFLNRGEKILSKIAKITSNSGSDLSNNNTNNRAMVFSVVSPPKEPEIPDPDTKRKSSSKLKNVSKKLKLDLQANQNLFLEQLKRTELDDFDLSVTLNKEVTNCNLPLNTKKESNLLSNKKRLRLSDQPEDSFKRLRDNNIIL